MYEQRLLLHECGLDQAPPTSLHEFSVPLSFRTLPEPEADLISASFVSLYVLYNYAGKTRTRKQPLSQ